MKTTFIAWSRSFFYMLAFVAAFGFTPATAQVMTSTISATASVNTYTVAAGVTSVTVDMVGASGGNFAGSVGGKGGRVQATLAVTPGQVLYVCIGGVGGNGIVAASAAGGASVGGEGGGVGGGNSGGSGGGGATSIRTSITGGATSAASLNTRLLVAGGGGGGNYSCALAKSGGGGGYPSGLTGLSDCGGSPITGGGSQTAGGAKDCSGPCSGCCGGDGALGAGGAGNYYGGGGGGGGGSGASGGGGSCYIGGAGVSSATTTNGFRTGNGYVIISYTNPNTAPVFVNGATTTLNICANAGAVDIKSLLHVSDANASQTLTWSIASQPSIDGTVVATSATASSGSTDVTPGGTLTYQAGTGYTTESFKMRVSDGTASDTITVVVNIRTITSIVFQSNVTCNGGANGGATISSSGGTPGYSYSWAPSGGTLATATGLTPGTYTCTISDVNLCTHTQIVIITEPSAPLTGAMSQTNIACNGGSNGVASVSASGGTPGYTYSWVPGLVTTPTVTGLAAGTYTCYIKDANLCTQPEVVTITEPSALTVVGSQTNIACNGGTNGAAAVSATGGTPGYTYSWAPSGGAAASATGLTAGTYTCNITDDNSCTRNQVVTITQPSVLTATITATTNVSCNGGSNGSATVTAGGGTTAYAYSWSPSGGTGATATGLTAGNYTVLVTDANLCAVTRTVTITQPTALTANITATTNVSCNSGSNGTATVTAGGGTGAYGYSWTPTGGTGATATGLVAGDYTVTVTDANFCTATTNTTITEPTAITANITATTNVSCNSGNNGAATVTASGGTGTLTYSWAPAGGTAATANNLTAGTYTVTIEDANLCTLTETTTITQPSAITSSVSAQTNVDCNGNATGAATITAGGGTGTLVYSWAPVGGSLATATGLTAGNYTCNITDDNLCVHTQTVTITQPNVLATSISAQTNVTCHGGNNGAATVVPTGGTTPYNYSWSPIGGTTATGTGFTVCSYTCTVTDDNGCTHDQVVAILEPALPVASISGTTAICKDENADVIINGPAGTTVAYTINGGSSQNALMDANGADTINSGALTVTATYALVDITEGTCTYPSTGTAIITVKPFPTVDATTDQSVCNGAATTPVIFTGSVSGTLFTWTNDNTTTGISANGTDSITTLTLTNNTTDRIFSTIVVTPSANGCTGISDTFVVASNPTPVFTSVLTAPAVCNTTLFSYTPTSATATTTFAWSRATVSGISNTTNSGSDDPNETLTNTTTDPVVVTYVYTLTANSCGNTQNVTVTVQPTPVLTTTLTAAPVCNSTLFTYVPASATAGTAFDWSRAAVAGISNAASSGSDDPNETLINTTTDPIVVTYVYTLTANSCTNTQNVAVTVQPTPMLTSTLTAAPVCNNNNFSYTPASATTGTAFTWSRAVVAGISNAANTGTDNPNETLVNTTADPIVVTYVYTLTANSCNNTQNVTVTVQPTPMLTTTLTAAPVCNNTLFSYLPASATAGTAFTWSRAAVAGITNTAGAGNDDPNETLVNTTTDPIVVTYIYTLTANSCSNIQSVDVTVQPTPVLTTTLTAAPVCNNTLFSYVPASATTGTAFAWSRATVSGISNAANSGNDDPNETLTNTTADPIVVTYVYTLIANSCSNVQSVDVTVQPTPMLTTTLTAAPVCNTTLFSYVPASATVGTTFAWSRAAVAGISNAANSGSDNPNETLTNTTADPIVVTYVYTLTANSCDNIQNVTVTVQPTPMLSSTLTPAAICNNTTFNYTPTSATAGTTFDWSRAAVAGITNTAAAGSDDPNEVLTNTTTDPIVVTYVYTLTANGCNNTESVTVTVNPTPVLTSTLTVTPVCDSSLFSYTPTSATAGTTYSWSRATVSGISNAAGTGSDDPLEYLVNTTPDPVNVIYIYTLTANSCNNVQSVTTTVYPKPLLSTTLTPPAICDNSTFSYTPASLTTGVNYIWSRAAVAGISNAANADNTDPIEVLNNTTTDPIAVTYIYTLTANGCTNTQNVVVIVNPTPVFTSTLTPAAVCDSTLFSYAPTSATAGTAFSWSRATVAGISNTANTGTNNPLEYLVNTTPDPIAVTYVYTLTANTCANVQSVTVVVNPKPLLTTTLTLPAICDSTLFSYTPASATVGTVFTWSRATVAGIANTAANGSNDPMEYLDNTTANPLTVVYIDTLFANGCYNTQAVSVVVNSTPMLSSTLTPAAICNNTTFNYTPTSATIGTTFNWTRATVAGISNAAGTGTNNPAETLNNTTNSQVAVTYVYTLTANGCSNTQVVTMTVNPTPVLSGLTTATVCSSTPLTYTPGSTTTGASFAWTRAVVAGISNAAGTSTGSAGVVNETLVNTTLFPVNVTYRYTLTAFGCSNVQNVIVTVNPAPQAPVIAINSPSAVCSNTMYQNFGAANAPTDSVVYTWTAQGAVVHNQGDEHTFSIVNFPTAGNANVILTANINGIACYTADTFRVTVGTAVALNPEIFYIYDHFVCTDNTVDSYQWGYDDANTMDSTIYTGEVDQNFRQSSPDFAGKHYWVMTEKGGCLSKSYYNRPVGITPVGVAEVAAMSVFPNPASDNVAVEVSGINGGTATVEVSDITGKRITTVAVVNNKAVVNVNNLASGVYMITCYHNGVKVGTTKLVKE